MPELLELNEILSTYSIRESEFLNIVQKYKIPSNKGKYKRSVLAKYLEEPEETFDSSIIAVSNQKGGEGKTTVSLFLAEALSKNHKVLLLDWDAQANITNLFYPSAEANVFDCLGYHGNDKTDISTITRELKPGLHLVPSGIALANFTTPYERDDFELLKEALLPLRSSYEYIIIDCPPSLGLSLENALIAADYVIVPIQTRAFSVQGLKDLHETIEKIKKKANKRLKLLGAVLNQYEESRALAGLADNIKNYFPVFDTVIVRRESIPQAQAKRSLLADYDTKAIKMFEKLAEEIMEKIHVKKG